MPDFGFGDIYSEDPFGYATPQDYYDYTPEFNYDYLPSYEGAPYSSNYDQTATNWTNILNNVLKGLGAARGLTQAGADIFGGGSSNFRNQTLRSQPSRSPFGSGEVGSGGNFGQLPDWQRLAGSITPNANFKNFLNFMGGSSIYPTDPSNELRYLKSLGRI